MVADDMVLVPVKTKRAVKEKAQELFASRGLTMTAGVNMLLTDFIAKKTVTISFGDESVEPLSTEEQKNIANMKNLSSFLDSIPG